MTVEERGGKAQGELEKGKEKRFAYAWGEKRDFWTPAKKKCGHQFGGEEKKGKKPRSAEKDGRTLLLGKSVID